MRTIPAFIVWMFALIATGIATRAYVVHKAFTALASGQGGVKSFAEVPTELLLASQLCIEGGLLLGAVMAVSLAATRADEPPAVRAGWLVFGAVCVAALVFGNTNVSLGR